jgi:16S rRNA (guanine966-N2)-methyltransferase
MVRIIAGRHRGRRLATPDDYAVRPSADRVRTAFFNILGAWIEGRTVLDLFAGAGGIGLECLSRGAAHVTLVERNDECCACLRTNASHLGELDNVTLYHADVHEALGCLRGRRFDLVYADPPYRNAQLEQLLAALAATGVADLDSIAVVEHSARDRMQKGAFAPGWECYRNACYGAAQLSFFSRATPAPDAAVDDNPEGQGP